MEVFGSCDRWMSKVMGSANNMEINKWVTGLVIRCKVSGRFLAGFVARWLENHMTGGVVIRRCLVIQVVMVQFGGGLAGFTKGFYLVVMDLELGLSRPGKEVRFQEGNGNYVGHADDGGRNHQRSPLYEVELGVYVFVLVCGCYASKREGDLDPSDDLEKALYHGSHGSSST
ncbi:hypothetical protein NE237_008530 [Protea cynaroides]|uniref:Uncharacterized protein n=1 Tax=Protea cynaroides TaxID=273540 RepID=A0A9Q0KVY7_9MAGN|nr:hypothetical protein NE237_008530 [Protea cynaroides]